MEKAFGYSQMRFNYITDYAIDIAERAVQMEMVWVNRDNFKAGVDVEEWLKSQAEDLEISMRGLSNYLKPMKQKNVKEEHDE